jgi:hypothetical protein
LAGKVAGRHFDAAQRDQDGRVAATAEEILVLNQTISASSLGAIHLLKFVRQYLFV